MRKSFPHPLPNFRSHGMETPLLADNHQAKEMTKSFSYFVCPESFSFMSDFGFLYLYHSLFSFSSPGHTNIKCYKIHNSLIKIHFIFQQDYFILIHKTQTRQVKPQTRGDGEGGCTVWVCGNQGRTAGFSICGIGPNSHRGNALLWSSLVFIL